MTTTEKPEATTIATITPELITVEGEDVFDFSQPKRKISFKLDDDIFHAIDELPGLTGLEFAAFATTVENTNDLKEQAEVVERMFRLVLIPASADRFIDRLRSTSEPIGVNSMNAVMMWLMEQYGLRPTQPSEASSDGS